MNLLILSSTLLIGVISGFIGAAVGGGGLISVSFLVLLGIPPQITLATSKFGGLGMSAGGLLKFIRSGKVVWKYVLGLAIFGVAASLIGAQVVIKSNPSTLNIFIAIMLLLMAPMIFLKRDFGIKERLVSKKWQYLGYGVYFLVSIIGSIFGGIGPLLMTTVILFFGLPIIKANATELVSYTTYSIVVTIIFISKGLVNFQLGVPLLIGMLLGGYLGAHLAVKKGNKFIKTLFTIVIIASALKILIGLF